MTGVHLDHAAWYVGQADHSRDHAMLPCSSGEGRALRIAASIAEGVPVDLREAVSGLDRRSITLVVAAVLHAAGHRAGVGSAGVGEEW